MLPRLLKHKYGVWTYGQGFIPARDFCLKKKKFAVEIQKLPPPATATDKTPKLERRTRHPSASLMKN